MQRPLKAGILGATGMVGQRFLQLLENHPKFTVETLGTCASEARNIKIYRMKVNLEKKE
jgi:aspartate-semialdehyde dehydrogenase